jgi:hypothetical protein
MRLSKKKGTTEAILCKESCFSCAFDLQVWCLLDKAVCCVSTDWLTLTIVENVKTINKVLLL